MKAHSSFPRRHMDTLPQELREAFIDPRSSTREIHRRLGHRVVDAMIDRLSTLASRPVFGGSTPEALNRIFSEPLPKSGNDSDRVIAECLSTVVAHSMGIGHPRHFGHMDGPPLALGIFGDLIAAALNQNLMAWELAPAAVHVERQVVRWLAEIVGLGPHAGGNVVSGGTEANLTALWVARNLAAKQDRAVDGKLIFFASEESHLSLEKAADLLGVGLIRIQTGDDGAMLLEKLEREIRLVRERGERPFAIVATAGTTGRGAVDPLAALAESARVARLWFHVDAAHGGAACCSKTYSARLRGIESADSVTVDPHKWFGLPKGVGAVLFREVQLQRQAVRHTASYLSRRPRDGGERINPGEFTIQGSRRFDALKVWLALKQLGVEGIEALVDRCMAMTAYLTERVNLSAELEALHDPMLNLLCFRYRPRGHLIDDARLDTLTEEIQAVLEVEGHGWLSLTTLKGRRALRAVILNPWTDDQDIDAVLAEVVSIGRRLTG